MGDTDNCLVGGAQSGPQTQRCEFLLLCIVPFSISLPPNRVCAGVRALALLSAARSVLPWPPTRISRLIPCNSLLLAMGLAALELSNEAAGPACECKAVHCCWWCWGFVPSLVPSFRDSPQQTLSLRKVLGFFPGKIVLLYYPVMFW